MPDTTLVNADAAMTDRAWMVRGVPAGRRTGTDLVRVVEHDLSDETGWGELVRAEVAAARADTRPARAVLARLAPDRHLAVVVTRGALDPEPVLAWLLDPLAPEPEVGLTAAPSVTPTSVDLPAALRGGGQGGGSASTLHRVVGPGPVGLVAEFGVPAEAVLATAVAVLLGRYRGRPDVDLVVATPRPVSVPVTVDERASVGDLVRLVAGAIRSGTPLRTGSGGGIAVAYRRPGNPRHLGGCEVTPVHVLDGRARHELAITLVDGLLRVDHDAGLFAPEAVATFADRLGTVLTGLVAGGPVGDLCVLTDTERTALRTWSTGEHRPVPDARLHELVARHAVRTPDAVAVVCGDRDLSYAELNVRANRVAHRLIATGTRPGDLIAVLAGRAVESVVAMLGVLKAGAAYVPIEPSYPAERINHILADSGARLVPEPLGDEPVHDPDVPVGADDLAYVIYTSGSTGTPKGVAVSHRNIVVSTEARAVGGPTPERDLVTMPLCFDGAAGGLYWTLTGGGTAVLPTDREAHDPSALRALLRRAPVTHVHSVPSHYDLVLRSAGDGDLAALRLVSVGGEPMPATLVARHLLACPDALLLNDYGPTECSVWATAHRCGFADATGRPIPIGGPLPNYRVHVLDARLRPVPAGLDGELYLGGPAVARGYHRRAALTAEHFLPEPFGRPGERIYRTGDRGRWTEDGELHILGRIDNQVKVRGFRVELGEIEAAVRSHPRVAECVVQVRRTGVGERLLAFAASADAGLGDQELRSTVARLLPVYMHPDTFLVLPSLPRGPNGKVDAAALRDLDRAA